MVRGLIGVVLGVASVVWLWRAADLSLVLPLLESAHPVALGSAIFLLGMSLMMKSFRWRTLLPANPGLSPAEAYRIFHISILLNNLLPLRLGDGARVMSQPVRRVATAQQALVVLVLERLLDGAVLACVAMIVVPIFLNDVRGPMSALGLPSFSITPLLLFALAGIVVAFIIVTFVADRHQAAKDASWRPRTRLLALRRDILLLVQLPRREVAIIGLSTVVMWVGVFSLHFALFVALNAPSVRVDPFVLAVVVTVATNLSMLMPTTPANIGIFHAAAAAPLLAAGYPTEVAVAYAVIVHAVNTVPPMLVGVVCLGGPAIFGRVVSMRGGAA